MPAILMQPTQNGAQTHIVVFDASAVVDTSGGGWLMLGAASDRTRLSVGFCSDGGTFVADDRVQLRIPPSPHALIVIEPCDMPPGTRRITPTRVSDRLTADKQRPRATLRGLLLVSPGPGGPAPAWHGANHALVVAALHRASSCCTAGALPALFARILDAVAGRCLHAPLGVVAGMGVIRPLQRLSRALEVQTPLSGESK